MSVQIFSQAEFSHSDDHRNNRCTTNLPRRADCDAPRIKIITPESYNIKNLNFPMSKNLFPRWGVREIIVFRSSFLKT
jgi:hypothetical protein